MTRAFRDFRSPIQDTRQVWTEHDSAFPFECTKCRRVFEKGGKRWIASSIHNPSHRATDCLCDDCKQGKDPLRRKQPKFAQKRTELD